MRRQRRFLGKKNSLPPIAYASCIITSFQDVPFEKREGRQLLNGDKYMTLILTSRISFFPALYF
jgi:hypothetical protein